MRPRIVVGITGASGAIYAQRFIELAIQLDVELAIIPSRSALDLLGFELEAPDGHWMAKLEIDPKKRERIVVHDASDFSAGPASGTYRADGMIIIPCSMKTLAAVAHGYADTLLTRCADVQLKERRPLVIVPRESPVSTIHLENMLTLARAGASIVPACPPFYHHPRSIVELVDAIVHKALAQIGLHHPNAYEWNG